MSLGTEGSLNGFEPFPDRAWNQDISAAALDPDSAAIISYIGSSSGLHADFGSGTYNGAPIGIPYIVVDSTQPNANVAITQYPAESEIDAGSRHDRRQLNLPGSDNENSRSTTATATI